MLEANTHSKVATWLLESGSEAIEAHQIEYCSPRVLLLERVAAIMHNISKRRLLSTKDAVSKCPLWTQPTVLTKLAVSFESLETR